MCNETVPCSVVLSAERQILHPPLTYWKNLAKEMVNCFHEISVN